MTWFEQNLALIINQISLVRRFNWIGDTRKIIIRSFLWEPETLGSFELEMTSYHLLQGLAKVAAYLIIKFSQGGPLVATLYYYEMF